MKSENEKKNEQLHTFELLAPAGSFEILRAVIAAGADAVYVGGPMFGARAYADNFTMEELAEAIDYTHLHGRKLYLTVNTLLKNEELSQLYAYLLPLYERGLDAVLVQDFGAFALIRENFPDLPIHTSTQMTVTGVEGARLLQELGARRIVMAREVSLAEMQQIHEKTGVELEAFVHGALCYCYSGQCLLSSMLGGRSGNRGRCAQPCRLAYAVLDEEQKEYCRESYVLSLKDLCGIEELGRLRKAGVYSLKIEGRMKQLSYAAGVVSFYRKSIDRLLELQEGTPYQVPRDELLDIADLGNRCGFTSAYYDRQNGADMVTFAKPNYEKTNETLQNEIVNAYTKKVDKLPVSGKVRLHCGKPSVFEVTSGEASVCVSGMEVLVAQKKPLVRQDVADRMAKTGDTPFVMTSVDVEMDEDSFLPNGALNQLRREALTALTERFLAAYRRITPTTQGLSGAAKGQYRENVSRVICLTENRRLLPLILRETSVTTVYLDFSAYHQADFVEALSEDVEASRRAGKEVCFALPRIFRERTAVWLESKSDKLRSLQLDGFLVRTYEELSYVRRVFPDAEIIIDHNLYTYNDVAAQAFADCGVSRNTIPLELNRGEIRHRENKFSEMVVYGRAPLMTSAQCVHGNTKGCDGQPGLCYLKDRYHTQFPVRNVCSACYNVIYNSLPTMLFAQMGELQKNHVSSFRLDFTVEQPAQVKEILHLFTEFFSGRRSEYPAAWQERYTNGHYKRGVE